METDELLRGLLDRLARHLREVEDWDKYVDAFSQKKDEISVDDDMGLTDEQLAAMMFWRSNGISLDDEGEVKNDFDHDVEDDDGFIAALADWLLTFEANELEELKNEGSFAFMADALLGIYHIGLEVGDQTTVISVGPEGVIPKERARLTPLSDAEVDEILRKRRGYGLRH